ncbi:transcriptional regulator [Paenibacillus oryzae]|uniref:Transcriptional regulator n=1 Tax=Paenibacillus oryzae TaxID=1844972 RepID=A0A1A5YQ42_9BACL|nr:YafY family protein [Paenibacillus oryzae]OBR67727.1 transcriptional regulator [Paenibacillus oryzae]
MNKTDRMLAIVLELQRHKILRAEDLAATFETSVRTIYRDIQALSEAGVAIIGSPGQGYSLIEGYFLPPVSFTAEEAVALLLGTDFIEQWFDSRYAGHAQTSRRKLEAILPEAVANESSQIRKNFRMFTSPRNQLQTHERANLEVIHNAMLETRKISFHYNKRVAEADGNTRSVRTAAPYGLVFMQGWVLVAWCELRQSIRHFRLLRMTELAALEAEYKLPEDFRLAQYKPPDDRHLLVKVLIRHEIADQARETGSYYLETMEEKEDGWLATLRVRQPEELLQWLLGFGSGMVVLEPEVLRERVKNELQNMLKRY